MDESSIAIKPVSEMQHDEVTNAFGSTDTPNEVLEAQVEVLAADVDVVAPLMFIGGTGGSQYHIRGWNNGKVITKIRVYSGEGTIKAYTIWLTDLNGTTYGEPGSCNYADFEFENGERINQLTLWGNGEGSRAGWIEFVTSNGRKFSYGMHGWDRKTPYPVEVASGVMVGCIFNAGCDIDAHGFYFLNHIDYAQLTNIRYPTLDFETVGIAPKVLKRFEYTNNSTTARQWLFQDTQKEEIEEIWSVTTDVSVHASITVQAGIPEVAEAKGEYGWQVSVTGHYETTQKSEQELSWNVSGTAQPGDKVDLKAVTRKGTLNVEYSGTMEVKLKNGASFSYPMNGTYKGISYSGVEVVDHSTM